MRRDWFEKRLSEMSETLGYKRPELYQDTLKLDSNENYVIPKSIQNDIVNTAKRKTDIRAYPLGRIEYLIQSLANYTNVPSSMISVGNGSDQILDLLLSNFASSKTKILTANPSFSFVEDRCRLYGIPIIRVPFVDHKFDIKLFERHAKSADILYIDSPNNPTGFQFQKRDLQRLVRSFDGLIILDEAYAEFADYTLHDMARTQKNLIITRTMSKSFGLAGIRLGYCIANKRFTETFMNVIQYPYPLSSLTIESAISALERVDTILESVNTIKKERMRVVSTLQKYDTFEVFDSKANFVLFDARGVYSRIHAALLEQGISIRKLGKIGKYEGCLRVTIGTREMNSKFLLAIRDLLI